jgi:hypothetical protein
MRELLDCPCLEQRRDGSRLIVLLHNLLHAHSLLPGFARVE